MTKTDNSAKKYKARLLQKLIIAYEDINFASYSVQAFIEATSDKKSEQNCRDFKECFFYAAIVSYSKMFVNSRGNKLGILKKSSFETLKTKECHDSHQELLKLRNEVIAHNDGHSLRAFIGWDEVHKIHFPQRIRKKYWQISEAQRIWALMKCLEKEILHQIYEIINTEKLEFGCTYEIEESVTLVRRRIQN